MGVLTRSSAAPINFDQSGSFARLSHAVRSLAGRPGPPGAWGSHEEISLTRADATGEAAAKTFQVELDKYPRKTIVPRRNKRGEL